MGVWQVRSHELSSLLLGIYKQISVWFGRLKTSWINYKNNWVGKEWRFAHEHSRWLPRSVIMTTGTTVSMVSLSARRIWNSLSLQWGNKNIFRCSTNFIDQFWARLTNWGGISGLFFLNHGEGLWVTEVWQGFSNLVTNKKSIKNLLKYQDSLDIFQGHNLCRKISEWWPFELGCVVDNTLRRIYWHRRNAPPERASSD